MKTHKKLINLFIIILALASILALSGCGTRSEAASSETTVEAAEVPTTKESTEDASKETTTSKEKETTTEKETTAKAAASDNSGNNSENENTWSSASGYDNSNSNSSNSSSSSSSSNSSSSSSKNTSGSSSSNSSASQQTTQATTAAPQYEYSFTVDAGGSYGYFYSGTLYSSTEVSVYDLLCQTGLSLEGNSHYVSAINGLSEFDHGKMSGWMYSVNGTTPMIPCGEYYPKSGDTIYWWYSYDE